MTPTGRDPGDPGEHLGNLFVDAVAAARFDAMEQLLAPGIRFRALLPRRIAEAASAAEARAIVEGWFGDCDRIEVSDRVVERVADRVRIGYRLQLHEEKRGWLAARQEVVATANGDRFDDLALLCTGFRPVDAPADVGPAATPTPHVSLVAYGDSCATLTPRIRSTIRALEPGQVLEVLSDDPGAEEGLRSWSRLTGHALVAARPDDTGTRFYLRRA